jgi:hypothetical protein
VGVGDPSGGSDDDVHIKFASPAWLLWRKESGTWQQRMSLAPLGGTTAQVLKKSSNADGDIAWAVDDTGA